MFEKFIARQPIFDDKLKLYAYELLFRKSDKNVFEPFKEASGSVIVDSTMLFDLQSLTGHAKAFINLDESALRRGAARLLPPGQVVIEILETVAPSPEVVQLCGELRDHGYTLALDDYVGHPKWEPLLSLVRFLKVDFRGATPDARAAIAARHKNNGMHLLAEKVETQSDLLEARSLGYTFFQGFFFCKPTTFSAREIPADKLNYLRLLQLVSAPDFNYDAIEDLLKTDPSLVYKLLRYLNSPLVAVRTEVHGIREAVSLIGEKEFRRWISVLAVVAMASDKPHELVRTALTRAFFCEAFARSIGAAAQSSDHFLMGLLSVTDAILDRPIAQILASLPVSAEVRNALCGGTNSFRDVYNLLLAYEGADWATLSSISSRLGASESLVIECETKAREAANLC